MVMSGDDIDYDLSMTTSQRFIAALTSDGRHALTAPEGEYQLFLADARDCATQPALRGVHIQEPIVVAPGAVQVIDMTLGFASQ